MVFDQFFFSLSLFSFILLAKKHIVSQQEVADEIKLVGGHSIERTGRTNQSSRSLLAWNQQNNNKKSSKGVSNEEGDLQSPTRPTYREEPTKEDNRGFLWANYQWSETRKKQYCKGPPFGVDESASPPPVPPASSLKSPTKTSSSLASPSGNAGSPKPLSAMLKSTALPLSSPQKTKSLRDFINN